MALLCMEPRIDGDEGRGKHALAEKILQKIGNAKRGAKCVRGIRVAEVVRKDAIAHEPDQTAEEDADGDEKRMRFCGCAAGWSGQRMIIGTKSSSQALVPSGVLSHISKPRCGAPNVCAVLAAALTIVRCARETVSLYRDGDAIEEGGG